LKAPEGIAINRYGNIFIADTENYRIRRVSRKSGNIETSAGTGRWGNSDKDEPAIEARLRRPSDLVFDGNSDLIIADRTGPRIKHLNMMSGILSTIAGAGSGAWKSLSGDGYNGKESGLDRPESVIVSTVGHIILADSGHERIRSIDPNSGIIETVVGTTRGFHGDGGAAINCKLSFIDDLALDLNGNMYILDGGTISSGNHRIRRVDAATGIITTIVGNGERGFSGDEGPPLQASIRAKSIAISPAGDLYIADTENHRIRMIRGVANQRIT